MCLCKAIPCLGLCTSSWPDCWCSPTLSSDLLCPPPLPAPGLLMVSSELLLSLVSREKRINNIYLLHLRTVHRQGIGRHGNKQAHSTCVDYSCLFWLYSCVWLERIWIAIFHCESSRIWVSSLRSLLTSLTNAWNILIYLCTSAIIQKCKVLVLLL